MQTSARAKADQVFGPGPIPIVWFNFPSPEIAEVAAEAGFPAGLIDLEHSAISLESAQRMMMAMKGTKMKPLMRLPETSTGLTKRVLDIGASGIFLPYVESVDDVKQTIEDMTYGPKGKRGQAAYVNRASKFGFDVEGAIRRADEETLLVVMIESRQGVSIAGEIAALDGVDALFFGPSDFCFEAGRIDMGSQQVLDAYREIEKSARAAGKMMGTAPFGEMMPARLAQEGCDLFAAAADAVTLKAGFSGALDVVYDAVGSKKGK